MQTDTRHAAPDDMDELELAEYDRGGEDDTSDDPTEDHEPAEQAETPVDEDDEQVVEPPTDAAPPATTALTPGEGRNWCQCSVYEVVGEKGETIEATGCQKTTTRKFAPGHDAKLKSMLIRAGAGARLVRERGGNKQYKPIAIAQRYGFGKQVEEGIWSRLGIRQPAMPDTATAPESVEAPEVRAAD